MSEPLPFVSVIMPIRNEERFIAESLGAVLAQDYPHDRMEVIVADGMSTDKTREIIQALTAPHTLCVTLIENLGATAPVGLNTAFAQARGDIIIRVDGHCVIASNYVSRCVHYLQTTEADGVGGVIETVGADDASQAIAAAMSSRFGVGNVAFRTTKDKTAFVDTVPFPAYTRKAIEHAGPYNVEFVRNQDDEYNYRLRKLGYRILLASDIKSKYFSRSSMPSLWRQYYRYGVYKVRVMQKHPRQMQWRHFVPFGLVAALTGSFIGALFIEWFAVLLAAVITTYVIGNIAASLSLAHKSRWVYLIYLPLTFVILHFSYGLGFARGLVKFWSHWRSERLHVAEAEY